MTGKYAPLTAHLRTVADRGQRSIELTFAEIAALVGGLPESASTTRQWWANSSHPQALAWRAAGFHVEQVYLDRGRVRFERGARGGSLHDVHRTPQGTLPARAPADAPSAASRDPIDEPVDVHVVMQWSDAGTVELDAAGKLVFGTPGAVPGLYRMTLTGGRLARCHVYIGETDNLRRRLSTNYRSPGLSQQTSLRINALLREHLAHGGRVALAIAERAYLRIAGADATLDLGRKAARLLAENAALVTQQIRDDADIVNLG